MARPDDGTFGWWLEHWREERAWSQGQLADACDPDARVFQSKVSKWERGEGSPPNHAQADALFGALALDEGAVAEGRVRLVEHDRRIMAAHKPRGIVAQQAEAAVPEPDPTDTAAA